MKYCDIHYKEKNPRETVSFLIKKLYDLGARVTERWNEDNESETCSLRLRFNGTSIGSNGKGIDREYARASAYGELFERLQNDILFNLSDKEYFELKKKFGFMYSPDEKYMSVYEIIKQGGSFIEFIMKKEDAFDIEKQCDIVRNLLGIEGEDNSILCLPFYSIGENRVLYLPYDLYSSYYGSNGMAAGNTAYEAIVQGMSEIFERVSQERIHKEHPCLPEIPLESLKKYPHLYNRMKKLKDMKDYNFKLIDCSFGGEYPVVGLIVIEKNSGKYGLKLGCHPNYAVAIERTITEASQGHNISKYSNRSILDFFNREVDNPTNITNGYKYGHAQFPYQLFGKDYVYDRVENDSQKTNKEYYVEWKDKILNKGYDILIRDVGYLGFPSYHIIIPGLSEIVNSNSDTLKAKNTRRYVIDLLENIENVNKNNCQYIISVLNYYADDIFSNRLSNYFNNVDVSNIPYKRCNCDTIYFVAMCYIMLEDYVRAYEHICMIENIRALNNESVEEDKLLLGIKLYLEGMCVIKEHDTVMDYLMNFFDIEILDKINNLLKDPKDVLVKQYTFEKKINNCDQLKNLINNIYVQKKNNIISQNENESIFMG